MKKLFAVLVALTLVLSMGTIALAADDTTPTGTITITNAAKDAEYELYRIFDLVSYDASKKSYSYKLSDKWNGFEADEYFIINDNGYVEWVSEDKADNGEAVNALVKLAMKYAEDNSLVEDGYGKATKDGSLTIDNLPLGYYLLDTSLGTLCSITTNAPNAEITEKNQEPNIDKFVQEDSEMNNADKGWGKVNDADIDQVVNYKSTITVGEGAVNYIMHDKMTEGLTYNKDAKVFVNDVEVNATNEDGTKNYTVTVSTKESPLDDGCTFEIKFEDSFINTFEAYETFEVRYSATLNQNAIIIEKGNDNTVKLTYGEKSQFSTDEHQTRTFTWKMNVFKFTTEGTGEVALAGAKFQLLRTENDDDTAISFIQVTEVNGEAVTVPTYKVVAADTAGAINEITTDVGGKFEIVGLDEGVYYLHETEAPAGYNKLAKDKQITIESEYDETPANLSATYDINGADPATIKVENKTGSLLPSTGGIGTTIFYIVGITLMLGAAIVLISKKRMASFA